jgi:hypothetical protein
MTHFVNKVKKLSHTDIVQIQVQYDTAMDSEHGSGEHFILIGLLNQKGFRVNSYQAALKEAQRIIETWVSLQ